MIVRFETWNEFPNSKTIRFFNIKDDEIKGEFLNLLEEELAYTLEMFTSDYEEGDGFYEFVDENHPELEEYELEEY